jgi:NADPH:quinone reductase-like Zn-dependent oxidoreductase
VLCAKRFSSLYFLILSLFPIPLSLPAGGVPLAVAVRPLLAARPWLGDVAPAGSAGSTPGALRGLLARGEVNLVLAQSVLERRQPGGAAGGSGLAAIDIAKCLGARVIASVSTALKAEACRRHGADVVINHREQSIRESVLALTDGRGAEVIFDPVGGEAFDESLRCIAPEGRLITMGFASGTIPRVPANILLVKNFDVIGLYWGYYLGWSKQAAHPREEARVRAAMAELFAWCEQGRLRPQTLARYRLDDWRAALDVLAAREVIGRVVINPVSPRPVAKPGGE